MVFYESIYEALPECFGAQARRILAEHGELRGVDIYQVPADVWATICAYVTDANATYTLPTRFLRYRNPTLILPVEVTALPVVLRGAPWSRAWVWWFDRQTGGMDPPNRPIPRTVTRHRRPMHPRNISVGRRLTDPPGLRREEDPNNDPNEEDTEEYCEDCFQPIDTCACNYPILIQ